MSLSNPLIQERLRKIEEMKILGIDPYFKNRFDISHNAVQALEIAEKGVREIAEIHANPLPHPSPLPEGEGTIQTAGRIVLFRSMGKLIFATIQDQSGRLQICLQKDFFTVEGLDETQKTPLKFAEKLLDLGDFIGVSGEMFKTNHGELTLFVNKLTFLSKAIRPMPEKFHGVSDREICYRERNLDLMSNAETLDRFKKRSQIVREIRDFFHEKNYHELETRILQPQAGGAMAKVFETHHNALDHDFVLRIATELDLKMAIGGGFEGIFELGKNFRNEGIDPSHLQEFTSIEWYGAYQSLEMHEDWIEEIFHRIASKIFQKSIFKIMDKDENWVDVDFSGNFGRVSFAELLETYAKIDMFSATMEDLQKKAEELGIEDVATRGRGNLLDDIYKKTARPHLVQPTFVRDWPSDLKPLANPKGNGISAVSQLVIAGWEITNGYFELVDPIIQRKLLEEQSSAKEAGDDEAMEVDEVFLKAMEHGFPPMAGNAIGIDRLCAMLTGQPNLRDVVLFPTMKPEVNDEVQKKKANSEKAKISALKKAVKESQKPESVLSQQEILSVNEQSKRLVLVLNQKIPTGRLFNAVGHLSLGFANGRSEDFKFLNYVDKNGEKHASISHYGVIILKANNEQEIFEAREKAKKLGIEHSDFSRQMMIGTSEEQLTATSLFSAEEQEYFALGLFGETEKLKEITDGFELF